MVALTAVSQVLWRWMLFPGNLSYSSTLSPAQGLLEALKAVNCGKNVFPLLPTGYSLALFFNIRGSKHNHKK